MQLEMIKLMIGLLIGGVITMTAGHSTADESLTTAMVRTVATQEIEYLRRLYARATDRIGENTPEAIAEGRAVYHQIFTDDAIFRIVGDDIPASDTVGPDAWVDVVVDALASYAKTQHLIGTQLVEFEQLDIDAKGILVVGRATMTSYLQAWHPRADDHVWLFLGTYRDNVRYTPQSGWRIYDSSLERVSGEERPLGSTE